MKFIPEIPETKVSSAGWWFHRNDSTHGVGGHEPRSAVVVRAAPRTRTQSS